MESGGRRGTGLRVDSFFYRGKGPNVGDGVHVCRWVSIGIGSCCVPSKVVMSKFSFQSSVSIYIILKKLLMQDTTLRYYFTARRCMLLVGTCRNAALHAGNRGCFYLHVHFRSVSQL
jgi:hypothetical protein